MIKFVNRRTGSTFWVADNRVEEYKAAGHKLAADSSSKIKPEKEIPDEKEPETAPKESESDSKVKKLVKPRRKKA